MALVLPKDFKEFLNLLNSKIYSVSESYIQIFSYSM